MATKSCEVTINGVTYVPKEDALAPQYEGMEYCIVRTDRAGVFAGYVASREGSEAVVKNARRLWHWDGAASLSQLSLDGVAAPQNCKFPRAVPTVTLLGVIEILPCTAKAQASIAAVAEWKR
mgnify:CR=1 FL=1